VKTARFRTPALAALLVGLVMSVAPGYPILAASDGATSGNGAATGAVVCDPDNDCLIPYEYLASEETDPYLVLGKPPTIRADIRAAKRWPDVRSCLVRSERNAEQPDLTKINWKRMRRAEDIEVCMFRIFSSIRSETGLVNWFEVQDITWSWFNIRDYKTLLPDGRDRAILRRVETSTRPSESNRFLVKDSLLPTPFLKWIVRSEKFFVTWFEDGRVFGTEYGQSNLF